jgi:tetratricopeptide (TPR) repeat protein
MQKFRVVNVRNECLVYKIRILTIGISAVFFIPQLVNAQTEAAASSVNAECTAQYRQSTLEEFRSLYRGGHRNEALIKFADFANKGCATPGELALIGTLYSKAGDEVLAEKWIRKAIEASKSVPNETSTNLRFYLGASLWRQKRFTEAMPELVEAAHHPAFNEWLTFENPRDWQPFNTTMAEDFMGYADALENAQKVNEALRYRTAASVGVLKAAFLFVRNRDDENGVKYFSLAEQIRPLATHDVKTQVTILRDVSMALAFAKTGSFLHGMVAVEQLFELCKPNPAGDFTCPLDGVASPPFLSHFDPDSTSVNDRILELHLKIVAKILERTFISVSWDPETSTRRPRARADEFLGFVVDGRPYGAIVSPEEDRVETERTWMNKKAEGTTRRRVTQQIRNKRFNLSVKLLLTELMFYSKLGLPKYPEVVISGNFMGMPLAQLEKAITHSREVNPNNVPEETWVAFQVALRAVKIFKEASRWRLR